MGLPGGCGLGLGIFAVLGQAMSAEEPTRVYPDSRWQEAAPADLGIEEKPLLAARDYALSAGGSGLIVHQGKVILKWGDQTARHDLKSTSKSIGGMVLGLALLDGKAQLDDAAIKHLPTFGVPPETNRLTGWLERITLRMLANQTAGFDKPGGRGPIPTKSCVLFCNPLLQLFPGAHLPHGNPDLLPGTTGGRNVHLGKTCTSCKGRYSRPSHQESFRRKSR